MVDKNLTVEALTEENPNTRVKQEIPVSKSTSLPSGGKRRLAITRGFDNRGLLLINKSNPPTSAAVSPQKFEPVAGSTPLSSPQRSIGQKLFGISALFGSRSRKVASKLLPPKGPRNNSSLPSLDKQTEFKRQTVITPVSTPEASLDWDNFQEKPSYSLIGDKLLDQVNSAEPSQEDLLANAKLSLLSSSESLATVLSTPNMSRFEQDPVNMDAATRNALQCEMNEESSKLLKLQQSLYDLMDDFSVEDVNAGNIDRVERSPKRYI